MLPANALTVRPATEADRDTLRRLEILDTGHPLTGRVLVAEDDGTVIAALSLDERRAIADPFEPSAAALVLLRARADALLAPERTPSLRERLRKLLYGIGEAHSRASLTV
jgi:hypothetical protein